MIKEKYQHVMLSLNITKNLTVLFNSNYTAILACKFFFLFQTILMIIYKQNILIFKNQFNLGHLYCKIRKCNHLIKEGYALT